MPDAISARTLNRTTLQRQLLLDRAPIDAVSAVQQLVGLQAQVPANPYVGLWPRLAGFEPVELEALCRTLRNRARSQAVLPAAPARYPAR